MPRWTPDDLAKFALRRRARGLPDAERLAAIAELPVQHGPLATPPGEEGDSAQFLVRFTARVHHKADRDNACAKFHQDALRYAGAIPDDTSDLVETKIVQIKVPSTEDETVLVEVFKRKP